MTDYEFTMSLGIRHPDVDPAQITRTLGLEPQHVWRKGQQRTDHAGDAASGTHRESYWYCEFARRTELSGERSGLESELFRMLDTLRRSIGFMQDLHHSGGATELFVRIFARGDFHIDLFPEEAGLLGRLGVAMSIEVKPYPPGTTVTAAS